VKAGSNEHTPRHVAIIMDGNGRWATTRGFPRIEGHRRGGEAVREALAGCEENGVTHLTLYAFSAENWNRPSGEIDGLMRLLVSYLRREVKDLVKRGVRLHVAGEWERLPAAPRRELQRALEATAGCHERHLALALNYGSRQEAAAAARAYAEAVLRGDEDPADCTWERFRRYLFTADLPDPDLIIRTSGESRLSNFLLLQSAYAELFFSPVLWPDFTRDHFREAVEAFRKRERRFGLTSEQVRRPAAAAS